jgi:hypothetical protein
LQGKAGLAQEAREERLPSAFALHAVARERHDRFGRVSVDVAEVIRLVPGPQSFDRIDVKCVGRQLDETEA